MVVIWRCGSKWPYYAFFRFTRYMELLLVTRFFSSGMLESLRPKAATLVGFSRLTPTFSFRNSKIADALIHSPSDSSAAGSK